MMRTLVFSCAVVVLPLALGCVDSHPRPTTKTKPTEKAMLQGVIDEGVTLLDAPWLADGAGPMDSDAPKEFDTTDSGLQYRILRKSEWKKPTAEDSVTVKYRGWLDSGFEIDSSYGKPDSPSFALTRVVAGWTEGLQLIGTGGMIELWIPSAMGYGSKTGKARIPPNSALHFIIELEAID